MNVIFLPLCLFAACVVSLSSHAFEPESLLPHTALTANELAIIINENDPQSVQVGEYYQQARKIPAANVIRIRIKPTGKDLSIEEFKKIKAEVDAATPEHIQAYAVSWTTPYRVGCMSITSAFAFGYDAAYCGGCKPTKASPYFNASSLFPYSELKIRPAMMLAGTSFGNVKAMIDKGVASDGTMPTGDAYLVDTGGGPYNVRAAGFAEAKNIINPAFKTYSVKNGNGISFKTQVMFYFTGTPALKNLHTLKFLPGALADHLTSYGGALNERAGQSTALHWLEAGATASYGTVVEPCNYVQKFPIPVVTMFHYLTGASAIEAYWKGLTWPGEGVFVGEPLAKPFAPKIKMLDDNRYELSMYSPNQRVMVLQKADNMIGPYIVVGQYPVTAGFNKIEFKINRPPTDQSYLQLRW